MSAIVKHGPGNDGVIRVIITTAAALHPFSQAPNASQNYYCKAIDMKGFQIEIDLQALPPGVTYDQIQPNQVWWVEKRTSLYRIYLFGGIFDPTTKRIDSTATLPPDPVPSMGITGAPSLAQIDTGFTDVASVSPTTNTTYMATGYVNVNNNGASAVDQNISVQFTGGTPGAVTMIVPAGQSGHITLSSLYTGQTVGTECPITLQAKKSSASGPTFSGAMQISWIGIN